MKRTQLVLSCMIITLIVPLAHAEENNSQDFGKRRDSKQREGAVSTQVAATSQASGMHFSHIPSRGQATPAQQINVIQNATSQPARFQGINRSQHIQSSASYQNQNSSQQNGSHNQGFNNNVRFNNNSNFNSSSNLSHNTQFNTQDSHQSPHFTQGWVNHYRMPYRQGNTGGYRVHYAQSWPSNYGWRVHGWREDYRTVDPYWFAVITSMAVAQSWSDAEIAQAINDDNLRQQLIYDADVRQQMINSGYPANQIDYPSDGSFVSGDSVSNSDDQSMPPDYQDQSQSDQNLYPNQYNQDQVATQTVQTTQSNYYPPPNQAAPTSLNPSSPLYSANPSEAMPSGEQIANLNANKNALFFCDAGNKQSTALALRSVTHPDMSIWKTIDAFNRCAMWASAP
jgi:hypothetical protein